MCGIFGYNGCNYPRPEIMRKIAYLAGTRGCHSNGVAWLTPDGTLQVRHRLGKIAPETIFTGITSKCIIGHCRLSTSGPPTLANAQPIIGNGKAVAHNGTIRNYRELSPRYAEKLRTQCDSELLLLIPPEKLFGEMCNDPYACLSIADGEVTAMRRDMPLYSLVLDGGTYYCSRQFNNSTLIKNNK